MAIRNEQRGDRRILVLDIPYKTPTGERRRYRRDAQVQTHTAARAEHDRLLRVLATTGEIPIAAKPVETKREYTFGDAIAYFREHVAPTLKHSTTTGYEDILNGPHLRGLAKRRLTDFDEKLIGELRAKLVKAGNGDSSRRNHEVVIRAMLRAGVVAGYLDAFPDLPALTKARMKEPRVPTQDEIARVVDAARPHQRLALGLAALAGLRACEIRGLRRCDVDIKRRVLTVRRAICRGHADVPKNGHERVVPIATALVPHLEASLARSKDPDAPVSRTRSGKVWSQTGIRSALVRAQSRAGVSGWTLHTLRHSFVTELFRRGVGAPAIQRLAGHHSLNVTQRYSHVVLDDLRRAVDTLDRGNGVEMKSTGS